MACCMLREGVLVSSGCTQLQPCCCAFSASLCIEKGKKIKMSPSRFELETLSVLDSRDNRLHHGDEIIYEM